MACCGEETAGLAKQCCVSVLMLTSSEQTSVFLLDSWMDQTQQTAIRCVLWHLSNRTDISSPVSTAVTHLLEETFCLMCLNDPVSGSRVVLLWTTFNRYWTLHTGNHTTAANLEMIWPHGIVLPVLAIFIIDSYAGPFSLLVFSLLCGQNVLLPKI